MSNKSISIDPNPRKKPDPSTFDAFVKGQGSPIEIKPATVRLTIDIEKELHKDFRRVCLDEDTDMATELRRLITDYTQSKRKTV